MNSIRYRVATPWGLHARPCAYLVVVAQTCARDWEVIITSRGEEVNAKSIMAVMNLAAEYDSEIEFLSLMPDANWRDFTGCLESLFFVNDHRDVKSNAYEPIERIMKLVVQGLRYPCPVMFKELQTASTQYNCGPIFERVEAHDELSSTPPKPEAPRRDSSPESVDTFLCYDSMDFSYAMRIYNGLISRGLNVFFGGASLPAAGTSDFQLAIERALKTTPSMIVVATNPLHLEGGWVRAEWTTFLNEQRAGRKPGNLITVLPKTPSTDELPLMLRMFQSEQIPEVGPLSAERIDRLVQLLGLS